MFKYFAFISYSSSDFIWGKKLQRKLEHYKLPSTLCSERGWKRQPMRPVFFAPSDIQPGELSAELQQRLQASQHLVVICSPASAQSEWVAKEIQYFYQLGRSQNIHLFIVSGQPNSNDINKNCFNPVLKELGIPELLGANINEKVSKWSWVNKERAYVQLITKLLNIEFDAIWQRHRRLMIIQVATIIIGAILSVCAAFTIREFSLPVDIPVKLKELSCHNINLPPLKDATVKLNLQNEIKTCTVQSFASTATLNNIPRKYLGKPVKVMVESSDYIPLDTTIILNKRIVLGVKRDITYYGSIRFKLWKSGNELGGYKVWIGDMETVTDRNGYVNVLIPLEQQRTSYPLTSEIPLVDSIFVMPSGSMRIIEAR